MKISPELVGEAILGELRVRLARLRRQRDLMQAELASEAGVSKRTVERLEKSDATQLVNLVRVCRVLGLVEGFDVLIPEPMPSPVAQQ